MSEKFVETLDQADKHLCECRYTEAATAYALALKSDFNPKINPRWRLYYEGCVDYGTALIQIQQFVEGRRLLETTIRQLDHQGIYKKFRHREKVFKCKFLAKHNLAQLEVKFSYAFRQDKEKFIGQEAYKGYRNALNRSHNYFSEALAMILQRCLDKAQKEQDLGKWECQEYLKIKSNHLQLLLQEAEEFSDNSCLQAILDDVQRTHRFFLLSGSKAGEAFLYLCFYNKAMVLRILGRHQDSYLLLLQDYKFELQNEYFLDAEKSRKELFSYCLDHNRITQAAEYKQAAVLQSIYDRVKNRREIIDAHFAQGTELIRSKNKQFYAGLFYDLKEGIDQYLHDLRSVTQYLQQALPFFIPSSHVRAFFYFLLAECSHRLKDFGVAQKKITQAITLPCTEFDRRTYAIKQLQIWGKMPAMRKKVVPRHGELLNEINKRMRKEKDQLMTAQLMKQREKLNDVLEEYQHQELKAKDTANYSFSLPQENQLLSILQKKQKKQGELISHTDPASLQFPQERLYLIEQVDADNKKSTILNPEQDYIKKCQELGIAEKANVRQALIEGGFIADPFGECFNMSPQELHLLLPILKAETIDLRNHMVNTQAIDALGHPALVKSFKLNGTNNPSNQSILRVVSKMSALTYLSFTNFNTPPHSTFELPQRTKLKTVEQYAKQEPRSIVHVVLFLKQIGESPFEPSNLRVIKLKRCNLTDGHLGKVDWQAYSGLQEVSLSHNHLKGRQMHSIMALQRIKSINISDNPVCTLSLQAWNGRLIQHNFSLHSLKCRQVCLSPKLSSQLSDILERTNVVDLRQSQCLGLLVSSAWSNYLEKGKCLQGLEEWRMSKCDLSGIRSQQLVGLLSSCPSLRLADMRYCTLTHQLRSSIQHLRSYHKTNVILTPDNLETPNFDLFKNRRRGK